MKNKFLILALFPFLSSLASAGKIQNEDIKTLAELTGVGGVMAQLPNDTKIYVTGLSLNEQLSTAIANGDFGTTSVLNNTIVKRDGTARIYAFGLGLGTASGTDVINSERFYPFSPLSYYQYDSTFNSAGAGVGSSIIFRRNDGPFGAPQAVLNGDLLGGVFAQGYTGGAYSASTAGMKLLASQNFTGGANGSYVSFQTTPNGTTTPQDTLVLVNDKSMEMPQLTSAVNADGGFQKLYFKTDNNLYSKTSGGVETQISGGALADGSVTTPKLANGAVIGSKVANNITLPGTGAGPTVIGFPIATSSGAGGVALTIVRGAVDGPTGTATAGEGFTPARTGVGTYTVTTPGATFTSSSVPVVSAFGSSNNCSVTSVGTTVFGVSCYAAGVAADTTFTFIAIGPFM